MMMAATTFGQWCSMTAYHGVHDCYLARNYILKWMWALVIVVTGFLAVNQCVDFILDYALADQWTTNMYQTNPPEHEFVWPDVTICYGDRAFPYKPMWNNVNMSGDPYELAYLYNKERGVHFYHQFQADTPVRNLEEKLKEIRQTVTENQKISWQEMCERTVLHCSSNYGFRTNIRCNCSQFGGWSSRRGCFVMNLTEILMQNDEYNAGYEYGVQMLLNPSSLDKHDTVMFGDKLTSGLRLHVHFDSEENDRYSKPILVGTGSHILISMWVELRRTASRRTYTFQFYKPKPPCFDKFRYKMLNTASSSRTLCRQDCYTQYTVEQCGCASSVLLVPTKKNTTVCTKTKEETCQKQLSLNKRTRGKLQSGFNLSQCLEGCLELCEYKSVVTEFSSAPFPAQRTIKAFTKYLNRASADENVKNYTENEVKQMILVEMFFASKEYTVIERIMRVSLEELISSIGGTLGVWTGLSLIGIFQAFVYLIYVIKQTFSSFEELVEKWTKAIREVGLRRK